MKLLILFAAFLILASPSQGYQIPAEIYQAMAQDHEQAKGFSQNFNGGFKGHQSTHHQPVQQQSIQHIQIAQPHHIQYQSQPQHLQYENQHQHEQYQSQPQQVQYDSQHQHQEYQSQPQHFNSQTQHLQIQPQNYQTHIQPLHTQIQTSHIGQLSQHSHDETQHGSRISQHSNQHGDQNKDAKILNFQRESDGHHYQYAYETDNGIKAQEVGSTEGEATKIQGAYSYTGDDGQVYTVTYTADENGFRPSGAHLPTPPPMSEEIARSVEQNLKDEANGIIDDGHYNHEQHSQQSQQHSQRQQPSHALYQHLQQHNYEHNQHQSQNSQRVHQPIQEVHQSIQQPIQQIQHVIQVKPVQEQTEETSHHQLPSLGKFQPIQQSYQQQHSHGLLQQQPAQNLFQQKPSHSPFQELHQQRLYQQRLQQQPSHELFQRAPQHHHHDYHQQSSELSQQFQPIVNQEQNSLKMQPQVEEHRHVEYIVPSILKNFRRRGTDDYVGPAPLPDRHRRPKKN